MSCCGQNREKAAVAAQQHELVELQMFELDDVRERRAAEVAHLGMGCASYTHAHGFSEDLRRRSRS